MRMQIKCFNKTENLKIQQVELRKKIEKLGFQDFILIVPIQITIIS